MKSRPFFRLRGPFSAPGRLVAGSLLDSAALAACIMPATAASLGPLERISGPSPYRNCTADQVGTQDGTLYRQTEIEPWIDANPTRPRNMIAGWQQDRWSNGGARGDVSAFTVDGGATWRTVRLPNVTRCDGGRFKRASDPWVSFAPDGTAYFMTLAFDPDLPSGQFNRNAMLVSRSKNGGRSWSNPIFLVLEPPGQVLHDKNSLTADRNDADFAYAVWDRLRDFTLPPSRIARGTAAVKASASAGDGAVAARERARQLDRLARSGRQPAQVFFEGPVFFTRTTDNGLSWETPRELYDPGPNAQTINNLIVVQPNGAVLDFFTEILPNAGTRIRFLRSLDKGETFRGPFNAQTIATVFGAITPDAQVLIRDASILFDTAVDPRTGRLYLVWQDTRFSGVDQVAFSMSLNDGLTWSPPIRIDKTPESVNDLREQAIVPSIEVGARGKLVVTYYDFRFDRDDGREAADHWAIVCDPATANCRNPNGWGEELRLTETSFDMLDAPFAGGLFLGDYMGLVASGNSVVPAFGIAEDFELTSIYARRINLGAAAVAAK
jgi:hypothetical protein